jgi:hypothetical protein
MCHATGATTTPIVIAKTHRMLWPIRVSGLAIAVSITSDAWTDCHRIAPSGSTETPIVANWSRGPSPSENRRVLAAHC